MSEVPGVASPTQNAEERVTSNSVALHPPHDHDRSTALHNLALDLWHRFQESGEQGDLDMSIAHDCATLELRPDGHPDRVTSLNILASSLSTRFEQGGGMEDLEESITLRRSAPILRPEGHPLRSSSLSNVALSLSIRFKQGGGMEDIEESVTLHRSALVLRPEGHPDRSLSLGNLATSLYTRFVQRGGIEDFEESFRLLECATIYPFSGLLTRLEAVQRWSTLARFRDHHTTLKAYRMAIEFLDRALTIRPTLRMQHDLLIGKSSYKAIALEAASYAVKKGMFSQAIELLEQGRAILWSQMRGFRTPLDQLARMDNALADGFRDISHQLEDLATSSEALLNGTGVTLTRAGGKQKVYESSDDMMALKRRLSGAQEGIIREIRDVAGFEDFLKLEAAGPRARPRGPSRHCRKQLKRVPSF